METINLTNEIIRILIRYNKGITWDKCKILMYFLDYDLNKIFGKNEFEIGEEFDIDINNTSRSISLNYLGEAYQLNFYNEATLLSLRDSEMNYLAQIEIKDDSIRNKFGQYESNSTVLEEQICSNSGFEYTEGMSVNCEIVRLNSKSLNSLQINFQDTEYFELSDSPEIASKNIKEKIMYIFSGKAIPISVKDKKDGIYDCLEEIYTLLQAECRKNIGVARKFD